VQAVADRYLAAVSLTALEILPGEPSDLSKILRDDKARAALLRLSADTATSGLVTWLCEEIDFSRVEMWQKRIELLERDLAVRPIFAHESDYPSRLAECWDAPPMLFMRGAFPTARTVAIVGSRAAPPEAVHAADALARHVVASGCSVVSGLAAGVDTAAHHGSLAAGGYTVAVMGTGIRRIFPRQNLELAEQIAQNGALVSQFSPDAPCTGTTFLRRNSVIAGLADVDVVVAGDERSGSRHESEQAARYARPLLLWKPLLCGQRWANEAVDNGQATFIDDPTALDSYLKAMIV
jgi:DNA processing protein